MSADERPAWNPQPIDETHHHCLGCGEHVHPDTPRVYGDNDDDLFACVSCSTPRDLRQGAGKDPDYDPLVDRGDTSENHPIFDGVGGDGQ